MDEKKHYLTIHGQNPLNSTNLKPIPFPSDLSILPAKANGERKEGSSPKITRDKAYTYLKEAVDEIYEAGKYLFWKDEYRKKGYYSKYRQRF